MQRPPSPPRPYGLFADFAAVAPATTRYWEERLVKRGGGAPKDFETLAAAGVGGSERTTLRESEPGCFGVANLEHVFETKPTLRAWRISFCPFP